MELISVAGHQGHLISSLFFPFVCVTKPVAMGGKEVQWIIEEVNYLSSFQQLDTEHF